MFGLNYQVPGPNNCHISTILPLQNFSYAMPLHHLRHTDPVYGKLGENGENELASEIVLPFWNDVEVEVIRCSC
jgi:hypothetical protein